MLRVLMASQPVRTGWLASTTFSTVTHGALIAVAVVATNDVGTPVRESRAAEPLEHITYVEPAKLEEVMREARAAERAEARARAAARATAAADRRRDEALAALRNAADVEISVPNVVTQPDLTAVADAWLAKPDGLAAPTRTMSDVVAARAGFAASTTGVYGADMVERSVRPRRGNPKPRYPSTLANMGVEGSFVVRFVVDSTGDVPPDRIEFPSTMHRLFAYAVRAALLRSHYAPATIAGRVVPQQVVQEFRFEVGRRRR